MVISPKALGMLYSHDDLSGSVGTSALCCGQKESLVGNGTLRGDHLYPTQSRRGRGMPRGGMMANVIVNDARLVMGLNAAYPVINTSCS